MSKETAEQKLLKLIESSSPESGAAASGEVVAQQIAQAVRGQGFSGLEIPAFVRSLLGFTKTSSGSPGFSFGLKEINYLLGLIIIAVFVFLLVDFVNGLKLLQKKNDLVIDANTAKTPSNIILPVKNFSDYTFFETRNIFQPFEKKAVEEKPSEAQGGKKITAMTEKLKLVGVSWFDSAQNASVMIEDQENGITYFVRQGEKVKEMTVKTIYTDRVVLSYEDEETTIKL